MTRIQVKPRSKYNAKRTVVDGITFASMKEAKRYGELKLLEKAGEIEGLELQPAFSLMTQLTTGPVRGAGKALAGKYPVIGRYVADFKYFDLRTTERVVEDVKGFKTPLYRWKKKHVEAQYGIQILEV